MATVELRGVCKRFGNTEVLHQMDVKVEEKEFMVLVGPSGSGKSTALRLVAGLESPTSGAIFIGDREVTSLAPRERDIAMVFQSYALYPHMSVFDNMAFSLRLSGHRRPHIMERVRGVAGNLGIDGFLSRKPRQLSGGQRQRVAVGRAIVRSPKVFLLDEPLSNLDAQLRAQTRVSLLRLHQEVQSTVIYVTHDQTEAMTLGDRIVVLKEGVVQQIAAPGTVYAEPANRFVAGFIGSPAMNMLPLEVQTDGGPHLVGEGLDIPIPESWLEQAKLRAGDRVVFGIRPEHVRDQAAAERLRLPTLKGQVEITENLGPEVLVHVRVGDRLLTSRFAGGTHPEAGENITLGVDLARAHLFANTEEGPRLEVGSDLTLAARRLA